MKIEGVKWSEDEAIDDDLIHVRTATVTIADGDTALEILVLADSADGDSDALEAAFDVVHDLEQQIEVGVRLGVIQTWIPSRLEKIRDTIGAAADAAHHRKHGHNGQNGHPK